MRDHRPLAHAAAELERILVHAALRPRNTRPAEHLDRSLARCRLSRCWCSRIVSMIWLPTVCTGLSDVIGS